jgi:hypothetical protein
LAGQKANGFPARGGWAVAFSARGGGWGATATGDCHGMVPQTIFFFFFFYFLKNVDGHDDMYLYNRR